MGILHGFGQRGSVIVDAPDLATAPEWVSYASVVIALSSMLVALIFGLVNRSVSRKALSISQRQEARRESRIDLYIVHTAAWKRQDLAGRTLGINVQIANPSDRETSITRVELHLTYAVQGRLTTLKVSADSTSAPHEDEIVPLSLPFRLQTGEAKLGWMLFFVPADVASTRAVDRYDLVVRDVHGFEESLQVAIFTEAEREETD